MATGTIKNTKPMLIITANANQTYSAQLRQIESAYNALSDKQKAQSYIKIGNWIYKSTNLLGYYYAFDGGTTGIIAYSLSMVSHSAYKLTGSGNTNLSSDTNTNSMELYA